jgi:hypothetical protein
MKTLIATILFFCVSCSPIQPNVEIGKYYEVIDGLSAQYPSRPVSSGGAKNQYLTVKSLNYAFPDKDNDGNALYSIEVYKVTVDSLKSQFEKRVNYVVNFTNLVVNNSMHGRIVNIGQTKFNGGYCVQRQVKVYADFLNDSVYMNSMFFNHNEYVIHANVFTEKDKLNNAKLNAFFTTLKVD